MRKPSRFVWLDRVAEFEAPEKFKAILWPLAYHADLVGECHQSVSTLAREAGCDPRTARRRLRDLEAKGLIRVNRRCVPFHINSRILYLNSCHLTLPTESPKRPDTALSGHSVKMTGQNEKMTGQNRQDDRTKPDNDRTQLCPPNPIRSPLWKPIPEAEGKKADGLSYEPSSLGHRIVDYSTVAPPEVKDYGDIHDPQHDPVLIAMSITGETEKQSWGYWVKILNAGRRRLDPESPGRADRLFRGCVAEVFGQIRQGEIDNPGAYLNTKLKAVFR